MIFVCGKLSSNNLTKTNKSHWDIRVEKLFHGMKIMCPCKGLTPLIEASEERKGRMLFSL
jgi:hypothetical protein